ncbi:MAG: hypothetical protein NWF04_01675 [Candidatus Bathyarchaeota archaeon]|nr:hypothetical protein [Candidatus Bathyarchaeota archaeon]
MSVPKSNRILLSYITLRGYELESVYQATKDASLNFEVLEQRFSLEKGLLRECVSFLLNTGLLKTNADESEIARAKNFPDLPFKLLLLNQLRLDKANPFSLVHSHLIANDFFRIDRESLMRSVEKSLNFDFAWNDEKLNFWMDLASYLSLGRKYACFVIYPSPKLLTTVFEDFLKRGPNQHSLKNFLTYCAMNYFDCFTREGAVSKGLQLSLLQLNQKGTISIKPAASDDPNAVLLSGKQYGNIALREAQT